MSSTKDRVVYLHQRDPQEALDRLDRITGLRFARWPESLAQSMAQEEGHAELGDDSGLVLSASTGSAQR